MLGVGQVQVDRLVPRKVGAPGDLPQAGNTRADRELAHDARLVLRNLAGERGARADERHITAKNVEELGELVDRGLTQQGPDAGDARVVGHLEHDGVTGAGVGLVGLSQGGLHGFRINVHGAELKHGKTRAVEAHALLLEESGTAVVQAHHRCNDDPHRCQQDDADKRGDNVAHALDGVVGGRGEIRRMLECESRRGGACSWLHQSCHLCVFLLLLQTKIL